MGAKTGTPRATATRAALTAACALGIVLASGAPPAGAAGKPRIVAFEDLPRDAVERFRRAGVTRAALFPAADAAAIVGSAGAYRRVRRWRDVVAIYPERSFELSIFQTKPSLGVDLVHAGAAPLRAGYTGRGVTVAVFDTGIEDAHPDLDDRVAANLNFEPSAILDPITDGQYSRANAETPVGFDELQHGTLAAGIVAGTGESARGADMRGMAPEATLVNFKLIGEATHEVPDDVVGETSALASYQWMLDHRDDPRFPGGIRVATNSWGWDGTGFEPVAFTRMLQSAVDAGVAVVFAAGNSGPGPDTVAFPGRLPWIISVGASCKAQGVWTARCPDGPGQVADFSSRGDAVDVLAPGVDVWGAAAKLGFENTVFTPVGQIASPGSVAPPAPGSESLADEAVNRGFYLFGAGTSFATPHVAGIVALMLEANPALRQAEIEEILRRTATDLGPEGFDPDNGHGHVDAFDAVAAAAAPPPSAEEEPAPSPPRAERARPAPRCTAVAPRTISVRRPTLAVRCNRASALRVGLVLPRRAAWKLRMRPAIASGRARADGRAMTRVSLRLAAAARKRLRRMGGAQLKRLRPTLTVVVSAAAGPTRTFSWRVRLTR